MRSLLLAVVLSALLSAAVAIKLSAPGTPTSSRSIKSVEDVLNPQPHVPLVKSPLPSADLGAFDETEEADAALTKEMEHYDDADFDPADAAALGEANTQPAAGENNKRKRLLIDGITYSGPGCPIGSVKISFPNSNKITPKFIAGRTDQLEFQLRFLRLSTGRTHRPPHSINCQIQVKLRQDGVSCPVRLWVDAVAYANLKQGMSGALTISSKSGSNWLLQQNAYDQKLYGPFSSRIDWQAHGSDAFSLPAPSSTFNIDLSASMAYQSLAPPPIKAENLYVQVRTLRGTVSFPDCKP